MKTIININIKNMIVESITFYENNLIKNYYDKYCHVSYFYNNLHKIKRKILNESSLSYNIKRYDDIVISYEYDNDGSLSKIIEKSQYNDLKSLNSIDLRSCDFKYNELLKIPNTQLGIEFEDVNYIKHLQNGNILVDYNANIFNLSTRLLFKKSVDEFGYKFINNWNNLKSLNNF